MWEGQRYTLRNFSEEGIGLWVPNPVPFGLATGSQIKGDIVIGNAIHPVTLALVHQSKTIVGLRIVEKSSQLTNLFRKLLEPAYHAAELIRLSPEEGEEDPVHGFKKLCYRSGSGNELLIWFDPRHTIQALQLCWLGKWVYRQQFRHPITGYLKDVTPNAKGVKVSDSDLIFKHSEPEESILNEAAQFLGAAPLPLPGYRLWQFLEMGEQVSLPETLFLPAKVA